MNYLKRKREKIDRKKGIGGAVKVLVEQWECTPSILGLPYPYQACREWCWILIGNRHALHLATPTLYHCVGATQDLAGALWSYQRSPPF